MHGQVQRCAHLVLVVLLAAAAAIVVAPASRGADGPGPPNDAWSAPQLLSGASGSVDGTTVGATTDWNEPWMPDGAKATVWNVYTAARNGSVTFTATGSGFTTRIATCLGRDAGSCVFNASGIGSLTLQTFQGAQYRISVDTADGVTGPFTLAWGYDSTGPANDYIADAQELVGESGSIDGSNVGATTETNEPRHDGSAGENTGHSVWYRWTAPVAGTVFFDTAGSSFDTQLRAYTRSYDGSLVGQGWYEPDLNPWTTSSRVELRNVSAGATYLLAVDGEAGATGDIRLSWRTVVPQGDDLELPVIQMWSPEVGAHVTGTIHFMTDASDNTGVDRVDYTIEPEDSTEPAWFVGEAFAPPYDVEFDTSVLPPGRYSIDATAYDFNGNGASYGFKITVGEIPSPTLTLPKPFTREATRPDGAL